MVYTRRGLRALEGTDIQLLRYLRFRCSNWRFCRSLESKAKFVGLWTCWSWSARRWHGCLIASLLWCVLNLKILRRSEEVVIFLGVFCSGLLRASLLGCWLRNWRRRAVLCAMLWSSTSRMLASTGSILSIGIPVQILEMTATSETTSWRWKPIPTPKSSLATTKVLLVIAMLHRASGTRILWRLILGRKVVTLWPIWWVIATLRIIRPILSRTC
jgi:hypothetical protein